MTDDLRATPGSPDDGGGPARDPLEERIARALRSREPLAPDADAVAAGVEAQLAARRGARGVPAALTGRGARIAAAGLVTSTLAVAGAGAAAAANPYSPMARTFENLVQAVGIDWTVLGNGLTRAQYDAYWEAGYTVDDTIALEALWGLGTDETKARAGQMLLDGEEMPLAPGEGPRPLYHDGLDAYWAAGYGYEEAVALAELWGVDTDEAKARASQALEEGQTLPVPPPGTAAPDTGPSGTGPTDAGLPGAEPGPTEG